MAIRAEEKELRRIFSDDYLFEIPGFQRPYAWTTEQTENLFYDLVTALDTEPHYFLGSIVLIKEPDIPSAQIVDGQQRLTTLTILFCVLRELSEDANSRDSLDKRVRQKGDIFEGTEDRYRLIVRSRDRDLFNDKIQKVSRLIAFVEQGTETLSDSQRRMHENATLLYEKIAAMDRDRRDNLSEFLTQKCYLVVVSASDLNSAYRIFSVLNDRGLDLSPTDILKAKIIGDIEPLMRSIYTDTWEQIEEDLGRDDFRDLFTHIRMIFVKSKARGNLTREFENGVLSSVHGPRFLDTCLIPLSEAYRIVSRADYASTQAPDVINKYLEHLGRLDNFDWIPPAIAFFDRHKSDRDKLTRFTCDLERLAYGLFILRRNINDRISRYADLLREIASGADLFLDTSALQLTSEEKSSVVDGLDGAIYLQSRIRLPLLLRLDSLVADSGVDYDHRVISVEHVLPQTPADDSDWIQVFPDPHDRETWTHRMANLVLLSRRKNSQAGNFDFRQKKQEYFVRNGTTPFAITSQVLQEQEWTPSVLCRRQRTLIRCLRNEWRL